MSVRRPGPARWVWYALGGGLPPRYRDWVLYDATCRTWPLRHFARACVQVSLCTAPILLLVPGPLWVRLCGLLLGWGVAFQYALYNMQVSVDHRTVKAGWPPGHAQKVRDDLNSVQRDAEAARYAAVYRHEKKPPPGSGPAT